MKIGLKKGISLIALLITILVMMLLATVAVLSVHNSVDNTNIIDFMSDLQKIQDETQSYHILQGKYPTIDNKEVMTQNEIFAVTDSDKRDNLRAEMEQNKDYVENGKNKFYTIDLSKINVTQTKRGIRRDSDEKDIYLISELTGKVYYLNGLETKDNVYFSINPQIIKNYQIQ